MLETIQINPGSKIELYDLILSEANAVIEGEDNLIANLANISSILFMRINNINWAGFYLLNSKKDELVLGPFQGKPACTRIKLGKGVCGTAAAEMKTIIVPDVGKFPGHIYCDPASKSEIVVPIILDNELIGVLDLDSAVYYNFDETDSEMLQKMIENSLHIFK